MLVEFERGDDLVQRRRYFPTIVAKNSINETDAEVQVHRARGRRFVQLPGWIKHDERMEERDDTNRIAAERRIPARNRETGRTRGGNERIGNRSEKLVLGFSSFFNLGQLFVLCIDDIKQNLIKNSRSLISYILYVICHL